MSSARVGSVSISSWQVLGFMDWALCWSDLSGRVEFSSDSIALACSFIRFSCSLNNSWRLVIYTRHRCIILWSVKREKINLLARLDDLAERTLLRVLEVAPPLIQSHLIEGWLMSSMKRGLSGYKEKLADGLSFFSEILLAAVPRWTEIQSHDSPIFSCSSYYSHGRRNYRAFGWALDLLNSQAGCVCSGSVSKVDSWRIGPRGSRYHLHSRHESSSSGCWGILPKRCSWSLSWAESRDKFSFEIISKA